MRFLPVLAVVFVVLAFFGCGEDPDLISSQESQFVSYFKSNQLDSVVRNGVYVHVGNMEYNGDGSLRVPARDDEAKVEWGDEVVFMYQIHEFSSSFLTYPNSLVATNKRWLTDSIGWHSSAQSYDPVRVTLGSSQMIEGLSRGLPGSRRGDSVMFFLSSDLAFDKNDVGIVAANTPLVYILTIEQIKKK